MLLAKEPRTEARLDLVEGNTIFYYDSAIIDSEKPGYSSFKSIASSDISGIIATSVYFSS